MRDEERNNGCSITYWSTQLVKCRVMRSTKHCFVASLVPALVSSRSPMGPKCQWT